MRLLVFEYKVVDYQYFMDEMKPWELADILDNIETSVKNEWEQTRTMAFWAARPHYKRLKITDVLKFSWDNVNKDPYDEMLSSHIDTNSDDIQSLKKLFAGATL